MEWVGWLCGGLCLLATLLGMAGIAYVLVGTLGMTISESKTVKSGAYTTAWILFAKRAVYQAGFQDRYIYVLISPDPQTAQDADYMLQMIDELRPFYDRKPEECKTPEEAALAKLINELDVTSVATRHRVPPAFSHGRELYLAEMQLVRDHFPGGHLARNQVQVPCALFWEKPKSMIFSRPPSSISHRPALKK